MFCLKRGSMVRDVKENKKTVFKVLISFVICVTINQWANNKIYASQTFDSKRLLLVRNQESKLP